jgi:putative transposase
MNREVHVRFWESARVRLPRATCLTKNAAQQGIKNLGRAYANFFEDLEKYRRNELPWKRVRVPTFKQKGRHDSFRADNGPDKDHPDAVRTSGKRVKLPVIGWVAIREEVRFAGRMLSATISRQGDASTTRLSASILASPHSPRPATVRK